MKRLAILLSTFLFAQQNVVLNDDITFNKVDKSEIEKLKKEIQNLKNKLKEYGEDIDDLNERVDENEFQSSLNKIKWNGEFETTVANYYIKTKTNKYHNNNKWDLKLRLKMKSYINENLKFYGRLSIYKGWANNQEWMNAQSDSGAGRINGGSRVYLERAYVDYKIKPYLVLSIGRLPSNDGPGMNLKNNTPRKATYPALLFNGCADGIVLTYKNEKVIKKGRVRIAYGKGYQYSDYQNGYLANQENIKDLNVFGFFLEGSPFKNIGDNLFIFSAVKGNNFIANPLEFNLSHNVNVGDYTHYGFYFENNKAFKTNLNYFISYSISKPKSNGKIYQSNNVDWKILNKKGYAFHIGARYDFKKAKIGIEYNHGSKYWFSYTSGSYDPLNKLSTRGNAYDGYIIYPIDFNQFLRFEYTYIKYKYGLSGWHIAPNGEPQSIDEKVTQISITYNVKF